MLFNIKCPSYLYLFLSYLPAGTKIPGDPEVNRVFLLVALCLTGLLIKHSFLASSYIGVRVMGSDGKLNSCYIEPISLKMLT